MSKIKFLIIIYTILITVPLFSQEINIQDRIKTQAFYRMVYPVLFDKKEYSLPEYFKEELFKRRKRVRKNALDAILQLGKIIPEKLLLPLIFWKYISPNNEKLKTTINFIALHKLLILRDHIDHPQISINQKVNAVDYLKSITKIENINSLNVFEMTILLRENLANRISSTQSTEDFVQGLLGEKIISVDLTLKFPEINNYVLTYQGFIPGNKVSLISQNTVSKERIDWFNNNVIFNLKDGVPPLDWSKKHLVMPTKNSQVGHPSFMNDNPIFVKMRDMVDEAQDSIFIDIFLFGGTMGATFARYLIDQSLKKRASSNPNFKVLLLHDYATNYNMLDEMMPIFNYIKGRIEKEEEVGKMMTLLQANIQRHNPGIPFGISSLIVKIPATFKVLEKKSTYFESKIDHSKVMVIDANTQNPQAYFGSKNWSDHSGGYYFDNAIHIKGPAAALVQASYYNDVEAALTEEPAETPYFYFKEAGFDNKKYLPEKNNILNWMKVKTLLFEQVGTENIRFAEADVDGIEKNVRNILVDMILHAKSHIYMEQLFIYDRYITDALIKRKIQVPNLKIHVLADHNHNFGLNGLPNNIFLKELKDAGIIIRARKTLGREAHFPNGKKQEYHQENHRKITSVDGQVMLGGSSNLNADTLQGSFREFGAQLFDKIVIKDFEKKFVKDWDSNIISSPIEIDNFQVKIGEKYLSVELSALINGFASTLLQSKDAIEERHK